MTTAVVSGAVAMAAALSNAVDSLGESHLTALSDDEFLEVMRQCERAERKLAALNASLAAQVRDRGVPGTQLYRSTARFLSALLNLSPAEAAVRVRHADYLGPR